MDKLAHMQEKKKEAKRMNQAKKEAHLQATLAKDAVTNVMNSVPILQAATVRVESTVEALHIAKEAKYAKMVADDAALRKAKCEARFLEKVHRATKLVQGATEASGKANHECMRTIAHLEGTLQNVVNATI
jgi:hypothetical protein